MFSAIGSITGKKNSLLHKSDELGMILSNHDKVSISNTLVVSPIHYQSHKCASSKIINVMHMIDMVLVNLTLYLLVDYLPLMSYLIHLKNDIFIQLDKI